MESSKRKVKLSSYGRLGVMLACMGAVLAIDTLTDLTFIYRLWPLVVTVLGVGFIGIYVRRARREAVYIGVGVYLVGFSGLALYCSLTTWAALASLWPVFIALMGASFVFGYFFGDRHPAMLLAGLLSISLAALFYTLFSLNQRLWWSIFILAGISFLIFDKTRRS
jgi:hypothetical protein